MEHNVDDEPDAGHGHREDNQRAADLRPAGPVGGEEGARQPQLLLSTSRRRGEKVERGRGKKVETGRQFNPTC
jgi:hypothetical protein